MSRTHRNELSREERQALLGTLKVRFAKNVHLHKGLVWARVQEKLKVHEEKLWPLSEMERTGGEPDVVDYDPTADEYIFCDCSAESPIGRRSLCYDREGLELRKEHRSENCVVDAAAAMGIELLAEEQYRKLQELDEFDTRTSSWLTTPARIRKLGGAIFGVRRYDTVFVYHNGADSYYASRGFRGSLRV